MSNSIIKETINKTYTSGKYSCLLYVALNFQIVFSKRATEDEWWKSMQNQLESENYLIFRLLPYLSPTMWKLQVYMIRMS